ncbi:MAG: hypothetical protein ACI4PL_02245 [Faecousia sp.]
MRINRASRSSLLLAELMVSLLLFALTGAVCIRVMERSGQVSHQAQLLTRGVEEASSVAELVRAAKSEDEARALLLAAYPQARMGEDVEIPLEDGTLRLEFRQDQRLTVCYITWCDGEELVYSLEIHRAFEEEGL